MDQGSPWLADRFTPPPRLRLENGRFRDGYYVVVGGFWAPTLDEADGLLGGTARNGTIRTMVDT